MRPLALALILPAALAAATPLPLAERQVIALEFARPVARVATTDPDLLLLEPVGARLKVTALRAGRAQVDVTFDDGASAAYDVVVEGLRRPAAPAPPAPGELVLAVGETRRLDAPGLARLLVEDGGAVRARADGAAVVVTALVAGRSSLVLVDGAGRRTVIALRITP